MRDDERFIHFQECLTDLNSAWRILEELQQAQVSPVILTASFHMALVEYAKPFKNSRGANKRKHVLPTPALPNADLELHARLLELRDTVLAHSDLSVKDAKVYVGEISGQPFPLITSSTRPVFPPVAAVKAHVERVLDVLYAQIPMYEQPYTIERDNPIRAGHPPISGRRGQILRWR